MIAVCQVLVHILQCFFVDWLRQQKSRFLLSAENPRHEVPSARKQKEGSRKSLRVCYVCRGCGLYGCRYTKLLHSYFLIRNWSSINRMDASISVPNYRGCQQKYRILQTCICTQKKDILPMVPSLDGISFYLPYLKAFAKGFEPSVRYRTPP